MFVLGECIHVLSSKVKTAIQERDAKTIQELAVKQARAGANCLELNIGPAKKTGVDTMSWMVDVVQEVTDLPLSLDSTNAAAIEAGLKKVKRQAFINSTSADPERIKAMMPLAAEYNANLIALTLGATGMPNTADDRIQLVLDVLLPAAAEHGVPTENLYFDPLVLTITCNQDQPPQVVEAVRIIKQLLDPPLKTTLGLSNVSNGAPDENRPLINRIFLVMLLAAGLDSAIADPTDRELMEAVRIVEQRDTSTPTGQLLVNLYDATAAMEELDPGLVDRNDPDQMAIFKTAQILYNKVIYAHSYLNL